MFSNKVYDVLKIITLQIIPPLATLVMAVFSLWSIPYGYEISETLIAIDACLGVMLGISSFKYNKSVLSDEKEGENDDL